MVGRSKRDSTNEACNPTARAAAQAARPGVPIECDEYPDYASTTAGPAASLRFIQATDNSLDGRTYGFFAWGGPAVSGGPEHDGDPFLVVPVLSQATESVR